MQEAVAWIESLTKEGYADMTDPGSLMFYNVPIRIDFLSHLIRVNGVVDLVMRSSLISSSSAVSSSSGWAALFDAAAQCGSIRMLELTDLDVGEMALNALARLMKHSKSIAGYYLYSIGIQDNGVAVICDALVENDVIEDLDISQNSIGVEGARTLGSFLKANNNRTLASLNLGFNRLGDEGVVALLDGLKSNESLRTLGIGDCNISDEGAIALASLLEHGSHLKDLFLQGNGIGEAGLMAVANALKRNQSLQYLAVFRNPGLGGEGIESAFIDVFQNNVTLLSLAGIRSPEIEALLLRNKELIPTAVRRAALLLIGIRQSTEIEGMGDFAVFPKDIVRLIAQAVWATRRDPIWIRALK